MTSKTLQEARKRLDDTLARHGWRLAGVTWTEGSKAYDDPVALDQLSDSLDELAAAEKFGTLKELDAHVAQQDRAQPSEG